MITSLSIHVSIYFPQLNHSMAQLGLLPCTRLNRGCCDKEISDLSSGTAKTKSCSTSGNAWDRDPERLVTKAKAHHEDIMRISWGYHEDIMRIPDTISSPIPWSRPLRSGQIWHEILGQYMSIPSIARLNIWNLRICPVSDLTQWNPGPFRGEGSPGMPPRAQVFRSCGTSVACKFFGAGRWPATSRGSLYDRTYIITGIWWFQSLDWTLCGRKDWFAPLVSP